MKESSEEGLETPVSPEEPTSTPSTLLGRMANVYAAPGEVFDELPQAPASAANWLLPTFLLVLVSLIGGLLLMGQDAIMQGIYEKQDAGLQLQVEAGKMSQAQADQAAEIAHKVVQIMMVAGGLFHIFTLFFWAFALWLIGARILKGRYTYGKALELVGLASMVPILYSILRILLILVTGNLAAGAHPGLFISGFDPNESTLYGLVAMVDLMTLWHLGLLSLGMARLSRISFGKAAIWVYGFWILLRFFLIALGLLGKAAQGAGAS